MTVQDPVHPGAFGPVVGEAIVTGLGAAALSYGVGSVIAHIRGRRSDPAVARGGS